MKRMPRAVRRGRKFWGRPAAHDGLSVIIAYGNRCMSLTPEAYARHRVGKSVIVCHDGYRLSVIAGPGTNCSPRPSMIDRRPRVYDLAAEQAPTYHGPYHEVEVLLYGEEPHWWSRVTVLAGLGVPVRVPVSAVGFLIREHGGFARMHHHHGLCSERRHHAEVCRQYSGVVRSCAKDIGVAPDGKPGPGNHERGG